MRPKSIHLFERLYLASIALTLIATVLGWDALVRGATIPGAEGGAAAVAGIAIGVVVLVQLIVWYFVSRRGSGIAKWAAVVFFLLNLWGVGTTAQLAMNGSLPSVLTLAARIVELSAIVMLFRADANRWFTEDDGEDQVPGA